MSYRKWVIRVLGRNGVSGRGNWIRAFLKWFLDLTSGPCDLSCFLEVLEIGSRLFSIVGVWWLILVVNLTYLGRGALGWEITFIRLAYGNVLIDNWCRRAQPTVCNVSPRIHQKAMISWASAWASRRHPSGFLAYSLGCSSLVRGHGAIS